MSLHHKHNLLPKVSENRFTEQFLPPGAASESSKYGSVNDGFDEEERNQPENVASAPKYRKNPDAF